ncbi:hypothetical protein LR48_Vigan09g046000 [Vigna angularis]|uniref:Uncharacterized protein n=1 Tax=Phaseolus angularis TaxID=3914 RepID=A0A0L9V9P3_PHAAN|nr:hypothetical protein LR48_Vigan09g046000 [Vigna angularis]
MNLCSKCYGAIRLKEQDDVSTKSMIKTALSSSAKTPLSTAPPATIDVLLEASSPPSLPAEADVAVPVQVAVVTSSTSSGLAQPNRCAACRKCVGLTRFKCRCGVSFAGPQSITQNDAFIFHVRLFENKNL